MTTKALKEKLYVLIEYELYTILGVEPAISQEQLLARQKELVGKYHPARSSFQLLSASDLKNSKLIFTKLLNAYNILIDSTCRNKYDSLRKEITDKRSNEEFKSLYEKMCLLKKEKPFKDKLYILDETDLYVILDVDPEISNEELTNHYRQLVKKYHPDKYSFQILSGKESKELNLIFGKLTEAYNILKNPDQRAKFDQSRKEVLSNASISVRIPQTTDNIFKNSKIDPDIARKEQAEKFLVKGIQDYNNQSYDDAIKNFKSALEIFQKEGKYHLYLGMAMEKKGWIEYAKSEFRATLLYDPQNQVALEKIKLLTPSPLNNLTKDKKSTGLFNKISSIFQKK